MNPNQDYTQLGYDISLTRTDNLTTNQVDPLEFEQNTPEISGAKLQGVIESRSGRLKIDLDNDALIVSDGVIDALRFGKLADDTYGFEIQNKDGKQLMRIG